MPAMRGFSLTSMQSLLKRVQAMFPIWRSANKTSVKCESLQSASHFGDSTKRAHIYFLLDRSGSMQCIADDVIGGFNSFVREQQLESTDSAGLDMTLVQFDSKDPQ